MNTQQTQKKNVFKNIDMAGEQYIEQFKELADKATKAICKQMTVAKFEANYAFSVSKEQRAKNMSEVKEIRNELWQEALKESKGDVKIASNAYDIICAFP